MSMRFLAGVAVLSLMGSITLAKEVGSGEPEWLAPTLTLGPVNLNPSVHFNGAVGDSSGNPAALAVGHHDPTREDGTVQGLEAGLSLRAGPLEGFAVYTFSYGAEEEWDDELEEAFLKLKDIPGGFEVRGGRMYARFGRQNTKHLHAWDFVDMPLVWGRFLGDDGLVTDGGDITWLKQGISTTFGITVGYGEAKSHDHDHEAEEEHEENHETEGEFHEEDHDHHHDHAGEVFFSNGVGSGRAFVQYRRDDFNAFVTGVSLALGEDEADRQLVVAGADFSYTWRQNGLEPGGRAVTWLTEVLVRDIEDGEAAHEEHEEHGEEEEEDEEHEAHEHEMLPGGSGWGLYSQVIYTHNVHLDAGLRLGYVTEDDSLGAPDRFRVSPALTAYLDPYRRAMLRGQYNYDDIRGGDEEHSVWLQLGLNWGGAEVR